MIIKKSCLTVLAVLTLSLSAFAQTDCNTIQCDCENIPDADKDPGLKALCKYYEESIRKNCENGDPNPGQCDATAKGPNAWTGEDNSPANNPPRDKDPEKTPVVKKDSSPAVVKDIPADIKTPAVDSVPKVPVSELKYCKQLMATVEQHGYEFGHVTVDLNDVRKKNYFKEAWAYDYDGEIYVVVAMTQQAETGYRYKLSVQFKNVDQFVKYVYCTVSEKEWRKFSEECNDCDFDERFKKYIKPNSCNCL